VGELQEIAGLYGHRFLANRLSQSGNRPCPQNDQQLVAVIVLLPEAIGRRNTDSAILVMLLFECPTRTS
jgi:hypothetical protein